MIDYKSINAKFTPIEQDKDPEKWLELRTTGIGGSDKLLTGLLFREFAKLRIKLLLIKIKRTNLVKVSGNLIP